MEEEEIIVRNEIGHIREGNSHIEVITELEIERIIERKIEITERVRKTLEGTKVTIEKKSEHKIHIKRNNMSQHSLK